ncbi:MAG: BaiN/RdsA family NAD(P)/FAD-dependent oxidoreductase [Anaerolineae bacterium]
MEEYRIVVIGGGAAGLMAAGRAAELGALVLLLEKTLRLGSKLRITGKGRCNLTNDSEVGEFLSHLGPNASFMRNSLARFFAPDLIAFLNARGVDTVTERGRRVFPASNDAHQVVQALHDYGATNGVQIRYRAGVENLIVSEGAVQGVALAGQETIPCRLVILATGGLSYPGTGSTGDGYRIAREVGHTVSPPRPGLVPLVAEDAWVPRLQGLSLRNVRASLYREGRLLATEFGEMLFTHYGVSGPIILTLSMAALDALQQGPLRLSIDLKPALDSQQLDQRLLRDLQALGRRTYNSLLKGLLPRSLVDVFAELTGISTEMPLSQLSADHRRRVIALLKDLSIRIVRTRPIQEAIITQGGVSCREIDPRSMASRVVQGLYLAGELIDVAGDTGGYNLQVAFTTGRLAGEGAAQVWQAAGHMQKR